MITLRSVTETGPELPSTEPPPLVVPTVHLNGTSRNELVRQLEGAINALDLAETALMDAAPHGRDYYPQDKAGERTVIELAIAQHRDRLRRVQSVHRELMAIADHLTPSDRANVAPGA